MKNQLVLGSLWLQLFLLLSCKTEERIIPNFEEKPLASFSKYELPKEYNHLLPVGGTLFLADIPVDQKNTNVSAKGFSQSLGKSISSIPGELDLNFNSFILSADDLNTDSIEYMKIESIELEIPADSGKGDLKFVREAKIHLFDPNDKKGKHEIVLHYVKQTNNESCVKKDSKGKCDWSSLKIPFKNLNLIDYIKISEVAHKDEKGKKSTFEFQDFELKLDLKLDTPSGVKFKIRPKVKFVVGVKIHTNS